MLCTCMHTFTILFSLSKEGNIAISTMWMNIADVMLSEISQTQKDKYCIISLTCGILKSGTYRNTE